MSKNLFDKVLTRVFECTEFTESIFVPFYIRVAIP